MRKALRAAVLLLAVYLVQSTVLVYCRIGGVIPDLLTIALYACGYSFGFYGGVSMGLAGALLMEIAGGELAGMTTVWCLGAGCMGVYTAWRLSKPRPAGASQLKKLLWLLAPALMAGGVAAAKEALQLIYFYLTGVDIVFIHFFRVFFSGLEVMILTLILLPVFRRYLLCPKDQTLLAKRIARHKARKAEKAELEKVRKQKAHQDVQDLGRRLTYFVTLDDEGFDASEFPEETGKEENAKTKEPSPGETDSGEGHEKEISPEQADGERQAAEDEPADSQEEVADEEEK